MTFSSFGLSKQLLLAVDEVGYSIPTPIQVQAIPAVLSGKDVMAAAQTGTGKTASYTLPLLQRLSSDATGSGGSVKANHIRALVLAPTRELAVQIAESIAIYGRYLPLKSAVAYGGVSINPQMMKLRGGLDVMVATPGRLLDLYGQNAVKFSQLETLVLDEADRMLDMGFRDEIGKILALLPKKRQNLLFSATFSSEIRKLTAGLLKSPVKIEVSPRNATAKSIKQLAYEVDKGKKPALLSHLLRNKYWKQVLVFTRTKKGADRLVEKLKNDGISAAAIHGDKNQGVRSRTLADFKSGKIRILIATDIAARGIDINELPQVINFDLPKVPEDYIHRIGRTGRAGLEGEAISFVSADEIRLLSGIETLVRKTLAREIEAGFIPIHKVPLTKLRELPKKPKKAKKPKQDRLENSRSGFEEKSSSDNTRRGGKSNPKGSVGGRGRQRRDNDAAPAKRYSATKKRKK